MKTLFLLLFMCPLQSWAQFDTLRPIRSDTLKLIETDFRAGYGRYGRTIQSHYTYDGIDVKRVTDLGKYIRASGDANANAEFGVFEKRRRASWPLIIIGSAAYFGGLIGRATAVSSDPNRQTFTRTSLTYPYATTTTTVSERGTGGIVVAAVGAGLVLWGLCYRMQGSHVRRAVQYYNRSLKQRGISWQMQPCSSVSQAGVGLMGRF